MAPPNNRRPGFSRRAQYGLFIGYVVAVAGAIVAAAMLAFATFDPVAFSAARLALAEATTPVSSAGAWVTGTIAEAPQAVSDYFMVRQRNAQLQKTLDANKALLMRARAIANENRRLKRLMRIHDRLAEPVVAARLVSSSVTATRRYAVLNAGFLQGVGSGQPVRDADGLVGRVLEAGPNSARVLLLSDAESIVPVRRTRDGLPAIAAGRGDGLLEVRAANLADGSFHVGDVLVTSGTGGIYPPNIPVARIAQRTRDSVLARPFAIPDTFDYALVQRVYMPQATLAAKPEPPR